MLTVTENEAKPAFLAESSLGWIGLVGGEDGVERVTFGHASRDAAFAALTDSQFSVYASDADEDPLLERLVDFAEGAVDEFRDVQLDLEDLTRFQRRVIEMCRRIPYGSTSSYGDLAKRAGNSGAARAVGSVMASNRWPLIVPCHRVVQACGNLGGYSARQGVRMKRRLLDMESAAAAELV